MNKDSISNEKRAVDAEQRRRGRDPLAVRMNIPTLPSEFHDACRLGYVSPRRHPFSRTCGCRKKWTTP